MAKRHISVPKPLAASDPVEWFQKFEICSKVELYSIIFRWSTMHCDQTLPLSEGCGLQD